MVAVGVALRLNDASAPLAATSGALMTLGGFRRTAYDGNQPRFRVSGEVATLANTKLVGPFSLGFLYSISARNVTIETFADADDAVAATPEQMIIQPLTALVRESWRGGQLGQAQVEQLRVIEHRPGGDTLLLQAASCRVTLTRRRAECSDGTMTRHGTSVAFKTASYDGKTLQMRP